MPQYGAPFLYLCISNCLNIVMDLQIKALELKALLLKIYRCKKDFELLVINKKPKTRAGSYIVDKRRIRVYSKWSCSMSLEEIAIHEYAHHIHETEKRKNQNKRQERTHGPEFWRIYSALSCKATQMGLYNDELVGNIMNN